ncbi:MAG: hypothetical protein KC501_13790 [Myxococcales bacterium]|nr:hypothetical protein [Myxococcales bacterium]
MTTQRIPAAFALGLGALGLLGTSCTAIFAPRDDVQRCGTADDCDPTGDNRYVPVCKFDDENLDLDSSQVDKICVADFKPNVACDARNIANPNDPYRMQYDVLADPSRYVGCADTPGAQGCPAAAGCAAGLQANSRGLCDDTDPSTPPAFMAESEEMFGQDVRDQFCRSFFCDSRFVCDGDSGFCVQCKDGDEPGEGGCGQLYIAGAPSCAYQDAGTLDSACPGSDVEVGDVAFGACP